jgi:hypothetical protein
LLGGKRSAPASHCRPSGTVQFWPRGQDALSLEGAGQHQFVAKKTDSSARGGQGLELRKQ